MIKTLPSYCIWAFFAVCNLAVAPLMDWFSPHDWGAVLVYWCLGMIAAQAGLVAIWFALWPESTLRRLVSCLYASAVLFTFWAIGYAATYVTNRSRHGNVLDELQLALLCLPAILLAAQSPLWLARAVLRWRIVQHGELAAGLRQGNLTVRGLLIGTGLVALSLALARAALNFVANGSLDHAWLPLGIGVLAAAAIGLAIFPPALIAVLRARSARIGSSLFLVYLGTATAATMCLFWLAGIPFWMSDAWRIVGFFLTVFSTAAGLCVVLFETRRRGYRLHWGREQQTRTTMEAGVENVEPDGNSNGCDPDR